MKGWGGGRWGSDGSQWGAVAVGRGVVGRNEGLAAGGNWNGVGGQRQPESHVRRGTGNAGVEAVRCLCGYKLRREHHTGVLMVQLLLLATFVMGRLPLLMVSMIGEVIVLVSIVLMLENIIVSVLICKNLDSGNLIVETLNISHIARNRKKNVLVRCVENISVFPTFWSSGKISCEIRPNSPQLATYGLCHRTPCSTEPHAHSLENPSMFILLLVVVILPLLFFLRLLLLLLLLFPVLLLVLILSIFLLPSLHHPSSSTYPFFYSSVSFSLSVFTPSSPPPDFHSCPLGLFIHV